MTPVVLAARSHLRLRWRTLLALAVIFGLVAGVALTAAAGARRTETAYPRLLRWSHAANLLVLPDCVGFNGFYKALGRLPQVASMWTGVVYEMSLPGAASAAAPQLDAVASPDGKLGFSTDRVRIVAGRPFDPANPDAVMVDGQLARPEHLRPGSTLRLNGIPSTAKACRQHGDQRPSDIRNFAGVRDTPLVLGLVLAFLAVASLGHVLVTGVRRRRRDLAVFKTLGLSGHQVLATVLWQSAAITAAALAIGLPAGLLAGRWSWSLFASNLGVPGTADLPVLQILAIIPAALVLACGLAVLPARAAASLKPARALRAE
jgi:hypothetical protein